MRVHVLQHVPFEGLGAIAAWLDSHGATVTTTRFYEDAVPPAVGPIDLLIVMGGPMSVHDEAFHPWLRDEKRVIARAIRQEKAVLGICLGAQLIAAALGARVSPSREREIGWFPVCGVSPLVGGTTAGGTPFGFPAECLVFHWHGETFALPAGAVRLARSEACPNQAFQYGRRVVGLQFHLEMTPGTVRELVEAGRGELVQSRFVQTAEEILAAPKTRYEQNNRLMGELLSFLAVNP